MSPIGFFPFCAFAQLQLLKVRHNQVSPVKLPGSRPVEQVLQASSNISSKMRGYKKGDRVLFCLRNGLCASYTLVVQLLPMGRPEFPTTPINASIKIDISPAEQSPFVQPTLEGIELEQSPEMNSATALSRLPENSESWCGGMNGIAVSMLRLISCIQSKRGI